METTDHSPDEATRLSILEERLAELEAREADVGSIESLVAHLVPSDVRSHLRAARKEQLLAARAMLDHWIARIDRAPDEPIRRRESIKLE
jgi:BMFP domain-containing protein YqiC